MVPKTLLLPEIDSNVDDLLKLQVIGVIQEANAGLIWSTKFDDNGFIYLSEGHFVIAFKGIPNTKFSISVIPFTPLGLELLGILPARDARAASKAVALAMRSPQLEEAYLGVIAGPDGRIEQVEVFWQQEGTETTNPQE